MSGQNLALPCVLLQTSPAHLQTVFSKSDLDAFNGDLTRFTDALSDRLARLI